jgi:sec-independent protein translocase protein TatB
MFEVGFWELALLFALGLVVLGPEKLPRVANTLGRYAGQARRMARTLTAQIREEMEAEERRIMAGDTPAPSAGQGHASFSRPGADDLIPKAASTGDAAAPASGAADERASGT